MSRSFSRCLVEARRWTAPNAVCIVTLWAMFRWWCCFLVQEVNQSIFHAPERPLSRRHIPRQLPLNPPLQITFSPLVIHAQLLEPAICWVCLRNCRWSRFAKHSSLCSCLSQCLSCLWVRSCCLGHFLLRSSLAVSLTDILLCTMFHHDNRLNPWCTSVISCLLFRTFYFKQGFSIIIFLTIDRNIFIAHKISQLYGLDIGHTGCYVKWD